MLDPGRGAPPTRRRPRPPGCSPRPRDTLVRGQGRSTMSPTAACTPTPSGRPVPARGRRAVARTPVARVDVERGPRRRDRMGAAAMSRPTAGFVAVRPRRTDRAPARVRARRWVRIAVVVAVVLGVAAGRRCDLGQRATGGISTLARPAPRARARCGSCWRSRACTSPWSHTPPPTVACRCATGTPCSCRTRTASPTDDIRRVVVHGGRDVVVTDPDERRGAGTDPAGPGRHVAGEQVRDARLRPLHAASRAGPALTGGLTVTGQPLFGTLDSCYAPRAKALSSGRTFGGRATGHVCSGQARPSRTTDSPPTATPRSP